MNDQFLFVDHKTALNGEPHAARIRSPIYQDTATTCLVMYNFYVAGNISSQAILLSMHKNEVNLPIDFLHVDSTTVGQYHYRQTTIGRHSDDVQVRIKESLKRIPKLTFQ